MNWSQRHASMFEINSFDNNVSVILSKVIMFCPKAVSTSIDMDLHQTQCIKLLRTADDTQINHLSKIQLNCHIFQNPG